MAAAKSLRVAENLVHAYRVILAIELKVNCLPIVQEILLEAAM